MDCFPCHNVFKVLSYVIADIRMPFLSVSEYYFLCASYFIHSSAERTFVLFNLFLCKLHCNDYFCMCVGVSAFIPLRYLGVEPLNCIVN